MVHLLFGLTLWAARIENAVNLQGMEKLADVGLYDSKRNAKLRADQIRNARKRLA